MKKLLLLIFVTIFFVKVYAPSTEEITVVAGEVIRPYDDLWYAVCQVESGCNAMAYHMERNGHASIGIAQIQQSRVTDYNRRTGSNYKLSDMYDITVSKRVFMHYVSNNLEQTAREWNAGPSGMRKASTLKYWSKIKTIL